MGKTTIGGKRVDIRHKGYIADLVRKYYIQTSKGHGQTRSFRPCLPFNVSPWSTRVGARAVKRNDVFSGPRKGEMWSSALLYLHPVCMNLSLNG